MHPALFLLNSCILYVEQIIQKKGGNHSIYVVVNQHKIYLGPSKAEDESCFHFLYKTGICAWDSCTDSITTNCSMYICTHWKSIYTFIQNNLIKNVQKNNQTILQETLNKRDIVYRKLEELNHTQ